MHRPGLLSLALFATLAAAGAAAQRPPVVLDGVFDEWTPLPVMDDAADAPAPWADVRGIRARTDDTALYVMISLARELALQEMPGTLAFVLDTDADERTGHTLYGVDGAEAALEFSPLIDGQGRGGVMLRMADSTGVFRLRSAYDAGAVSMPTHASSHFEVRIRRDGALRMGPRVRLRIVSLDASGAAVDEVSSVVIPFAAPSPASAAVAADPLARAPGTEFRVVSWNVGRETIFEQPEAFGTILRALAPDLLMLDEVAGGRTAAEVRALLDRILPGEPWQVVYGSSGDSQRGVVAVRGAEPAVPEAFEGMLFYPDTTIGDLPDDAPPALLDWLDSRLRAGVPVTGAVVRIGGRRLLGVAVDLESGGAPGSPKDRLRRIEALAIREALTAAVGEGGVDGVLVTGDLNLVASTDPLQVLTAGTDVDGSDLQVPVPLRLDGASAVTWEDPEQPFTPGRLDFVLVGDAALAVTGGFVFRAGDLSEAWRARHGLAADASAVTDHLPLVTDLRWAGPGR